jgi:predicted aspartyl protease
MKHVYLTTYYPPMPALQITLGYPSESLKLGPFEAIIDTGGDGTIVPQALLDEIGAPFVDDGRIRSHWGEWRSIQLFTVDIGVNGLRLPAIEVVGDEKGKEILLGRNFLNKLNLLLHGPAQQVDVLDR